MLVSCCVTSCVRHAAYRDLVEAHLETIIITPDLQSCSSRNRNCTLIQLAQCVHLLHVLPICATKYAGCCLLQLDVIDPKLARVNVDAHLPEHELVCHDDRLSTLAACVICKVESATDEVDVAREDRDVVAVLYRSAEQLLYPG